MLKKTLIIVLVLAVLFAIGFYLLDQKPFWQGAEPLQEVTLGVEDSLLPASVWVAEHNGYFLEEGLDLTIEEFDSGKATLVAMLEGDQGIDISTAAPTPIMFNSFERDDFSIFATFAYAYEDIKVIANKDSDVDAADDLVGKKIGVTMGTTSQFFAETFLTYYTVSPDDVELMDFAPSDLPGALSNGEVDAIVIWEPHGSSAMELLGEKAIRLPSADVYKTTFNFMSMNDYANDNPEILEKFLRAIINATDFINNNDEESRDIVAQRLELDREDIDAFWDNFTFDISLDQSLLMTLEDEARWAIKNDFVSSEEMPNYLDYLYSDSLEAVAPEAVTIIK